MEHSAELTSADPMPSGPDPSTVPTLPPGVKLPRSRIYIEYTNQLQYGLRLGASTEFA